jgi:hypothetical protein
MLADVELSASAKCVGTALLLKFRNNKTGKCNPSAATIGNAVGRDRRNVFPAIKELSARGWLTIKTTGGGGKANTNNFIIDLERTEGVTPASPVPVTRTSRVMSTARGVMSTSHEPTKNHSLFQRESESGITASAPSGAALESILAALTHLWRDKPDGVNVNATRTALASVLADHSGEDVLASANRWASATPPRFLPKLDKWLLDGGWKRMPRNQQATHSSRKADPVAHMLQAGGHFED